MKNLILLALFISNSAIVYAGGCNAQLLNSIPRQVIFTISSPLGALEGHLENFIHFYHLSDFNCRTLSNGRIEIKTTDIHPVSLLVLYKRGVYKRELVSGIHLKRVVYHSKAQFLEFIPMEGKSEYYEGFELGSLKLVDRVGMKHPGKLGKRTHLNVDF